MTDRVTVTAAQHDAKRDVARSIRALAEVFDHLDFGLWGKVLRDDLPHIEANIAHIRKLAEEVRRG